MKKAILLFCLVVMATFVVDVQQAFACKGNNCSAEGSKNGYVPITICHRLGNGSYNKITPDDAGAFNGHEDHHPDDIIPAPAGVCGVPEITPTPAPSSQPVTDTEEEVSTTEVPTSTVVQTEDACSESDFVSDVTTLNGNQFINVYDIEDGVPVVVQSYLVVDHELTELEIIDNCGWLGVSEGKIFEIRVDDGEPVYYYKTKGHGISIRVEEKEFLYTFNGNTWMGNWETNRSILVSLDAADADGAPDYFVYIRNERLWIYLMGEELELGEMGDPQMLPSGDAISIVGDDVRILKLATGSITILRNSETYTEFTIAPDATTVGLIQNDQLCIAEWQGDGITNMECTDDTFVHQLMDIFTINQVVRTIPLMEDLTKIFQDQ